MMLVREVETAILSARFSPTLADVRRRRYMAQIKEPKPETLRIEELVDRVKQGDIKIPKFQRPFVWLRRAVLDLFDSVYRQYPIGSVLLWLTHEKLASERRIGDLDIAERPIIYPTNYLLDGQQRLSSLCGALYWDGKNPKSLWNVAFDLDKEFFFHPKKPLTPRQFPLNKLIKTSDFLTQCRILESLADKDVMIEKAEGLLKSIKDYKMAAVTIGDMKINEVAPIFERINSKGRNLEMVDLMRAATWKEGQEGEDNFDLNSTITNVRKALEQKHFADVPEGHILRSLAASADLGIYRESINLLRDKTAKELSDAANNAIEAYRRAVDFLTAELGLSSYAYMPYAHQLTLLVEIFRRCPKPSHEQRRLLKEWFWRTSFSGYFKLFNTGDQKRDLETIRSFADGKSDVLPTKRIDYEQFPFERFSLNTATSKTFGLLLVSCGPRSLLDGSRVDTWLALSVINRHEYHHIFPKAYLESSGVEAKRIQVQANMCLLSKGNNRDIWDARPSVYFKTVAANLGTQLQDVLTSNLISPEAFQASLDEDYDAFLRERAKTIRLKMKEFVDDSSSGHFIDARSVVDTENESTSEEIVEPEFDESLTDEP